MKIIEKIKGVFNCTNKGDNIKLNNYLVQEDLYEFLNSDIKDVSIVIANGLYQLRRFINDDNIIYYPYGTKEELEVDYLEIRRLIKKIK